MKSELPNGMLSEGDTDVSDDDAREDDAGLDERVDEESVHFWEDEEAAVREAAVEANRAAAANVMEVVHQDAIIDAQLPLGGAPLSLEAGQNVGDGVQELRQVIVEIRSLVEAIQQHPAAAEGRVTWASITCGIVGTVAGVMATIYAIKAYYEKSKALVSFVSEDLKVGENDGIGLIVKNLEKTSDQEYWERMASYVERYRPRPWDEQMLLNELTADISRFVMNEPFIWSSPRDKLNIIEGLASQIREKGLASTYRSLPSLRYKTLPVPRAISAKLISAAIGRWRYNSPKVL